MRTQELVRGWLLATGRHIAVALSGLVWLVIITRRLPEGDVGGLVLVASMPALLVPLLSFGMPMALSYLVSTEAYDAATLAAWTRRTVRVVALGTLTAAVLILGVLSAVGPWPSLLVVVGALVVPLATVSALVAGYFQGQRSFAKQAQIMAAPFVVAVVATIALAATGTRTPGHFALVLLGAHLATAIWAASLLGVEKGVVDPWPIWRTAWPFAWRTYVSEAAAAVRMRADLVIVAVMLGAGPAGRFGTATVLAAQLSILSVAANQVIFPMSAARSASGEDADADETAMAARLTLAITFLGAVVLGVVAKPILGLLYGPELESAWPVLLAYLPAVVLLSVSRILTAELYGRGQTSTVMRISLGATGLSLALLPACISLWGLTGAGVAASAGAFVNTGLRFAAYRTLTCASLRTLTVPAAGDARNVANAVRDIVGRTAKARS